MLKYFDILNNSLNLFSKETTSAGYIYYAHLANAKFIRYDKINLVISDNNVEEIVIAGENTKICSINYSMNISAYLSLSEDEKHVKIFELIFKGMEYLALKIDWDLDFFNKIKDDLIITGYRSMFEYIKKEKSPSGLYSVTVVVNLDFEGAEFVAQIYDKKKVLINSLVLYKVHSHPTFYTGLFITAEWLSETLFRISGFYGKELSFVCDLVKNEVEVVFSPDDYEEEELRGYLKAVHYKTSELERNKFFLAT